MTKSGVVTQFLGQDVLRSQYEANRASQAAPKDTAASTHIQMSVKA
jgi:hypothetical protein